MKVTEFSNKTKVDNVRPEWEKYLGKEDFISYKPSYVGGTERDKFEKFTFPAEKTGDIISKDMTACLWRYIVEERA